jgi:hypothetical protein
MQLVLKSDVVRQLTWKIQQRGLNLHVAIKETVMTS